MEEKVRAERRRLGGSLTANLMSPAAFACFSHVNTDLLCSLFLGSMLIPLSMVVARTPSTDRRGRSRATSLTPRAASVSTYDAAAPACRPPARPVTWKVASSYVPTVLDRNIPPSERSYWTSELQYYFTTGWSTARSTRIRASHNGPTSSWGVQEDATFHMWGR